MLKEIMLDNTWSHGQWGSTLMNCCIYSVWFGSSGFKKNQNQTG